MQRPVPQTTDILLIGGGHAHALVLKKWGMAPLPGARLTLVNPGPSAPYTGMLPGYVAGHYSRDDLDIDLVKLARFAGARIILDKVTGFAGEDYRTATFENRPPVGFDYASIDIGITSEIVAPPSLATHAVPAKPLDIFAARWTDFLSAVDSDETAPAVCVIGAGVGGSELAMAMMHALKQVSDAPKVTLIEQADTLLATEKAGLRRRILKALADLDIDLITNARVVSATAGELTLETSETLASSMTVTAAGARPYDWLSKTQLDLTDGFITVDKALQSVSHPHIFAVGDCAHMQDSPRPKAGVFAVRQAPVLYKSLRQVAMDGLPYVYRPQADYLKLVSLGEKRAAASKWGLTLSGGWLWGQKNRIDQRFMAGLRDLPEMQVSAPPEEAADGVHELMQGDPLCGGCGSKVGQDVLNRALSKLPNTGAAFGDDAAITQQSDGTYLVQTVDAFRAFTADPYLFACIAAIHGLGDIWAMGAKPESALVTLTLPPLSPLLQERTIDELMAGLSLELGKAGAALRGGHTAQGAEMSLGLSLTGTSDRAPITLSGARPGDKLILTKPIGSGVLLAGEMRGLAKGRDVAAAYKIILESSAEAAETLAQHATAMTDVTGFGLAGHLNGMLSASGVGAVIHLDAIELMEGAVDLARAGVQSSLWPSNARRQSEMKLSEAAAEDAALALLFDPQTAGGLLAAVPASVADQCPGNIIGEIVEGSGINVRL